MFDSRTDNDRPKRVQVLTIVAEISDGYQIHNLSDYFNLDDPHPDLTIREFTVTEEGMSERGESL